MQLFDERVAALSRAKNEVWEMKDVSRLKDSKDAEQMRSQISIDQEANTVASNEESGDKDLNLNEPVTSINSGEIEVDANANAQEDENSNVSQTSTDCTDVIEKVPTEVDEICKKSDTATETVSIKSPRPTVLNITPISLSTEPIEIRRDLIAKETRNRNKNRIMGHSVFSGEDYYQEFGNEKDDMQNYLCDTKDITKEALTNRLRNTGNLDAFARLDRDARFIDSNGEVIVDRLDLIKFGNPDNMTELQRNKLKILQEEYNWTPNNNEMKMILSDETKDAESIAQNTLSEMQTNRNRNTEHRTDQGESQLPTSNILFESIPPDSLSEMQINRNRNTEHRTDRGNNEALPVADLIHHDLTDAEKNRNRNMEHRTGQETREVIITENVITELTDCQKNRNRNMQHCTDQGVTYVPEEIVRNQPGNFTQAQKNRAKVMEQEFYIYGTSSVDKLNDENDLGTPFPISESASSQRLVFETTTPMSCTTDNYPLSMSSSMSQLQQYIDTPLSEMGSDIRSTLTTGEILTADTARSDITESGFKFPDRSPMFPKFLGFSSAAMTPTSESALTVTDVEMIDNTSLHVYLEKSIAIPLQVHSRLVNDAIIKYLLEEHKFLSHLHSLRSYFFLLNGEFAKNLTKSLFTRLYEITIPADLLNSATLNNLMNKALVASLSGTYANSERLSLSVIDVPSQLLVNFDHFYETV